MELVIFETCNDFVNRINRNDFPLLDRYLDYDMCYQSDKWIRYYAYVEDKEVIAVIGERLPRKKVRHVLIFEVNKWLTGNGFGKRTLLDFIKKSKSSWDLYSLKDAEGFYKKVGFVKKGDLYFRDKK